MTPSPKRSADGADRMAITGRRAADRRIRVKRQTSPYFRYAGPGTVTARPAASDAADDFEDDGASAEEDEPRRISAN